MRQQSLPDDVSVLRELDLGQHTLFIMSDKSIDLLVNEGAPYPDNLIALDHEEESTVFKNVVKRIQKAKFEHEKGVYMSFYYTNGFPCYLALDIY
jgi:hypothetical protein